MKVATGRIVEGKVVLEGEPLAEGSVVTVVVTEDDETFEVSPEDERTLLAAIAQAERGQVISWEELREQLRRFGYPQRNALVDKPPRFFGRRSSIRMSYRSFLASVRKTQSMCRTSITRGP